jgi:hypothetical protein
MVAYVASDDRHPPTKKQPYQATFSEWAYLAHNTHRLDPANMYRRYVIHGGDWITSTWGDCRKSLH